MMSESLSYSEASAEGLAWAAVRNSRGNARLWMASDLMIILASVVISTVYRMHASPWACARELWHGTLVHGRSMSVLLALLCLFAFSLVIISDWLNLYSPTKLDNVLQEQRLSLQACFTSGLLLVATLYLVHGEDISRAIVLGTVGLVTVALSLRRLIYRIMLYRDFERGVGTRNVLIVGTGPEAIAFRSYLETIRHPRYGFKGFIEVPAPVRSANADTRSAPNCGDMAGTIETLFEQVRAQCVDEIILATTCESGVVRDILEQARIHGVGLRMVPKMGDTLALNSFIEYIGRFPTIPLLRGNVPE